MSNDQITNLHETPATYWGDLVQRRDDKLCEVAKLIGRYGARARFESNPLCAELVSQLSKVLGIGGVS